VAVAHLEVGPQHRVVPFSSAMISAAAILFALICLTVCAFQLALIFGAPWGELTLGGKWRGALPPRVRALPAASLGLLLAIAAVILARAGVVRLSVGISIPLLAWLVVGYCLLGVIVNAATPSPRERALWLPVLLCMLTLSAVVASS